MAKLSELIPTLAAVLGIPETSVEAYAKPLRKAGLLTSSGRGSGGADMTPRDGANLLIAVMVGSPTQAVRNVRQFGRLTCYPGESGSKDDPLYERLHLRSGHSLVSAITRLIDIAGNSDIDEVIRDRHLKNNIEIREHADFVFATLTVEMKLQQKLACIYTTIFDDYKSHKRDNFWIYYQDKKLWKETKEDQLDRIVNKGDLEKQTTVSHKTINRLGRVILGKYNSGVPKSARK